MSTKKIIVTIVAIAISLLTWRGVIAYPDQAEIIAALGAVGVIVCAVVFFKTGE